MTPTEALVNKAGGVVWPTANHVGSGRERAWKERVENAASELPELQVAGHSEGLRQAVHLPRIRPPVSLTPFLLPTAEYPSTEQRTCLPTSRSAIESLERPTAVVGVKLSGTSRANDTFSHCLDSMHNRLIRMWVVHPFFYSRA